MTDRPAPPWRERLAGALDRARLRLPLLLHPRLRPAPDLGLRGERAAARQLRREGLRILARRARARRNLGEIDLVARDGDTLVFVEVKTRRRGAPAEAVTEEKQARLARAARDFLRLHHAPAAPVPCRFDVVAVTWPDDRRRPRVDHLRDAFQPPGFDPD